jgi:hypothetical protein
VVITGIVFSTFLAQFLTTVPYVVLGFASVARALQRRKPAERGLPDEETLVGLAQMYLDRQRSLWPELVKAGVLPPASDSEAPTRLAAEFRERFQGDRQIAVDANMLLPLAKAIAYLPTYGTQMRIPTRDHWPSSWTTSWSERVETASSSLGSSSVPMRQSPDNSASSSAAVMERPARILCASTPSDKTRSIAIAPCFRAAGQERRQCDRRAEIVRRTDVPPLNESTSGARILMLGRNRRRSDNATREEVFCGADYQ